MPGTSSQWKSCSGRWRKTLLKRSPSSPSTTPINLIRSTTTMVSTGALLWISCRPLLKMVLCTSCGFTLSKYDLFSTVAARGAGQVLLNVTIPSLMFSKMVPAFTPQNIGALGPLVTMGIIYHAIGFLMAFVVREIFWVPHRFRYGLLAAGTWGNYGDIPTAVIMSITASAPFSPDDVNLGVAYVSAFILVFFVTLFPMGGHRLIAIDFDGPNKEDEEVKDALKAKHKKTFVFLGRRFQSLRVFPAQRGRETDVENIIADDQNEDSEKVFHQYASNNRISTSISAVIEEVPYSQRQNKRVSFEPSSQFRHLSHASSEKPLSPLESTYGGLDMRSPTTTVVPTEQDFIDRKEGAEPTEEDEVDEPSTFAVFISRLSRFLRAFLTPATITILLAFPISLVRPLKGLFVPLDNSPIPNAPDGYPPLYFIYDTTNFLGAASVPLGLVCLGAALAKLKRPSNYRHLPLGAIGGLAIGKLIISPILGVIIVNSFVKIGFINEDDKVLRFVAIFFSCMPTATTQVFMTQVYSGTGEAEHLGAFLIPQYALMFVSMTALTAYTLHLLF